VHRDTRFAKSHCAQAQRRNAAARIGGELAMAGQKGVCGRHFERCCCGLW
jgi:hypothetical protein